ncbi:MAG TPA: serine/threonine-protein kinase [Hyalangium sp.]|nr:serine/threonine-protein kinase [Hyalangium sp.]
MKRPTTFGKYLLLERINVGGMAEVFIAKAFGVEGFERFLAIKKILPTMAEDQEFITMFIDEARVSVQLNHANVVHIHELGKYEETYYIAMEYVAGRDLRTILERYRRRKEIMPTAQAVYIASKMCEGLDYAHRKKDARGQDLAIIHRDVSPQNILISYEGEVKVIDFGIAKAANRAQKTQAGILKGKFGYMSPEQVRGMEIDRRSDIFAVGVILYEMLTGEKLFVGESDFSTLEKVRNAEVPPARHFNPNIPVGLEKVVLMALAREPEDRYQWASDLQEDLMKFLLAGDAIYSGKHLSLYMKEAFAEDMLREAEKMERYASIEKPDQLETSNITATPTPPPRAQRKPSMVTPVGPQPPAPVERAPKLQPPPLVPPPTPEELAEMDGAGDKTQIVDSSLALNSDSPVLFDDSTTGRDTNPHMGDSTGRTENPLDDTSETLDGSMQSPFTSDATMAAPLTNSMPALRPSSVAKVKSGSKPQVVIGDGEPGNVGATMIGPAPTSRPPAPLEEEEEEESTDNAKFSQGRLSKARSSRAVTEESEVPAPRAKAQEKEEFGSTGKSQVSVGQNGKKAMGKPGKGAKPAPRGPGLGLPVSPKVLIIAGAAVLLLGIIGTVVALAMGSSKGSLMITVEPATAKVVLRVDGQPVKPDTVIELEPGQHKLVAAAEGFLPQERAVNVTDGKNPLMVALKLSPEGAATAEDPDKQPDEPGKDPGEAQDPPKNPPETVAKPPDTPKPDEPDAPKTFAAVFLGDEGAEILVDGKPVGQTPDAKAQNLAVGKTYKFVARRAGYKPFAGEFKYDGNPEREVEFELVKEESRPPPTPQPTPKPVVNTPKPAAKVGKFAASTKPAGAQIWVDGRNTGRLTPVAIGNPLLLPVGNRKIVFKLNGKQSEPRTVTITEAEVAKLINVPVE